MKAILIYSGGLDSTTLLQEYRDSIALAVTFDYGSKHNAREIAFAVENCKRLGISRATLWRKLKELKIQMDGEEA